MKTPMKIVFASSNQGKIRELQALLTAFQIEVIPQGVLGVSDIEETGLTFVENALLKARHAAKVTGLPAIADDSGLEVPALNHAPGIYSARFAGVGATADANIDKLLSMMHGLADDQRQARFYCALVYLSSQNDPTPLICEGSWYGKILNERQGQYGFGYDPIFFDSNENTSAALLPLTKKNEISHRGQALRALLTKLRDNR